MPESLTESVAESLTQSLLPAQLPAQLPESLAELEGEALVKLWRLLVGDVVEVVVVEMFDCLANHHHSATLSLHCLQPVCSSLQSRKDCIHSIGRCVDGAQLLLQLA